MAHYKTHFFFHNLFIGFISLRLCLCRAKLGLDVYGFCLSTCNITLRFIETMKVFERLICSSSFVHFSNYFLQTHHRGFSVKRQILYIFQRPHLTHQVIKRRTCSLLTQKLKLSFKSDEHFKAIGTPHPYRLLCFVLCLHEGEVCLVASVCLCLFTGHSTFVPMFFSRVATCVYVMRHSGCNCPYTFPIVMSCVLYLVEKRSHVAEVAAQCVP